MSHVLEKILEKTKIKLENREKREKIDYGIGIKTRRLVGDIMWDIDELSEEGISEALNSD